MGLRWGIVGAGDIAARAFAPALAQLPGTELAAVCSRSLERGRAFAARFGAARAYDSLSELLRHPGLDAVYIATPNSLHAEQTIAAAAAGKHVLCEKPMATNVGDAERMIEACERAGVRLGVVFQNRYHPAHRAAAAHLRSGAAGAIDWAAAQLCRGFATGTHWSGWRLDPRLSGAGAIVAQAVHPIDVLRDLLGDEVDAVQAMSDEAPPARPVEEMVYCLLRFRSGAHATVVAGMRVPRFDNDVVIYGTRAKIACRATLGVPAPGHGAELAIACDSYEVRRSYPALSAADKMARLVADFERAVAERAPLAVDGRNGLEMVRIACALQESSRSLRAVRVR